MAKLSPMMEQYFRIKEQHKDHILFYRLGDFYEMFYDDAVLASKELELTLTGRDCGQEERAPMCGVPYHSCEGYIARLIKKGYKVAICEQMEDPRLAKGVVKREVIRVVTPGTLVETSMLDEGQNNFIASICPEREQYGLAVADISTGEIHAAQFTDPDDSTLKNELSRFAPMRSYSIRPSWIRRRWRSLSVTASPAVLNACGRSSMTSPKPSAGCWNSSARAIFRSSRWISVRWQYRPSAACWTTSPKPR